MQKKKHSSWKKSTKSTPAHQKKASHRKKAQKSTMVLLKALTMIPAKCLASLAFRCYCEGVVLVKFPDNCKIVQNLFHVVVLII